MTSPTHQAGLGLTSRPPASGNTIPMSFDDPIFTGMTEFTAPIGVGIGQTLNRASVVEFSGDSSIGMSGNCTLNFCRVDSRECIRVGGPGVFTLNSCYLRAMGEGVDHADCIQAYFPGAHGSIVLRNCHMYLGTADGGSNYNAGLWVADDWTTGAGGLIDVKDCIFENFAQFKIAADVDGDQIISCENVYFVGGCGPQFFDVGGHACVVTKWINVCNATIVSGVLIPGSPIANPRP